MSNGNQPFQRWEIHSFGDNRPSAKAAAAAASNVPKVSIEEVARIREEARAKGYADGLEEGRAAGLEQGRAEAAQEAACLRQIAEHLGQEVQRADDAIAKDVLALAIDMAQAMLRSALAVKPELVLPIVGEAIRYLPSVQQPALLYLNPLDAAIVKYQMHDELAKAGWRLVEDNHMQRGGCRIETASNQIDAAIGPRWQRLTEALGQHSDWLES